MFSSKMNRSNFCSNEYLIKRKERKDEEEKTITTARTTIRKLNFIDILDYIEKEEMNYGCDLVAVGGGGGGGAAAAAGAGCDCVCCCC